MNKNDIESSNKIPNKKLSFFFNRSKLEMFSEIPYCTQHSAHNTNYLPTKELASFGTHIHNKMVVNVNVTTPIAANSNMYPKVCTHDKIPVSSTDWSTAGFPSVTNRKI